MMKKKPSKQNNTLPEYKRPKQPVLRFSPTAWAKLVYFRDYGETEISGFGISDPDDPLCVLDFQTVKQDATVASISLDDQAIADFFDAQVDAGRKPEQFFRLWLHSHPGNSPAPSSTDEETFTRVFGRCDWAVMCVVAQEGKTYARLRFNVGPGGEVLIPVGVDYSLPFGPSEQEVWEAEYQAHIKTKKWSRSLLCDDKLFLDAEEPDLRDYSLPQDILEQLEEMEPAERQVVLDELAIRSELWDEESEVVFYD
jgi:proteasome lid subunit RPN8/RPN11